MRSDTKGAINDSKERRVSERAALETAIAALQSQRALLGDAIVDTALAPMREQLARLAHPVPGAPPEQVLRQVTVLFLDIVGSTALSQHLDPEEVHAVVDDLLERCTAVVGAHGGKVLQYAGDNLLAAFGAEQAREDDSERAVRCGLALLDQGRALGERVQREHGQGGCDVRIGVHTGPVLLGGGVDEESTIRGLTVNVAARMEQTAPPGALRISQDTWLLVRGVFDVMAQPLLAVKGHDEALVTYLVQRAKPRAFRVPSRGIEGVLPPMVGRDAELARLVAMADDVVTRRAPRALTIVGEPGLGKSRLLHELQGALEIHAERFWLLLGRALPSSRLQPYGMLRDLLAWRLQIADSEGSEQAKRKLVDGLNPWLGDRAEAKTHLIGQIIGLDFSASPHVRGLEPRLLRTLAFAALHDYLRGLTADGAALALLLEDLHWADDESLDFFAGLMEGGAALPLLSVATARPELLERRPAWGQGQAGEARLLLDGLDPANGEQLANALLGRVVDDAAALRALLIAQSDGNPFYMEELVRMFLDDGVIVVEGDAWRVLPERLHRARVPTTLVGVLQARLDALPPADRLALQQASIVGHVFWDRALAAIDPQAPSAVPALQRRALIHQRERSAFEDTPEEAFHHHLLQQVTYDTVLKPARRAGHAAAAQWLAQRLGDRPAEYLAITGDHYEKAGDLVRALDYFVRAADDAQRRFANQAALEYIERALRNPAATDPRQRELLFRYQQNVADLRGQRELQETALKRRGEIADALDDDALRADVLVSRALLASRRADETLAFELATQAVKMAARSGNASAGALALGQVAYSEYTKGRIAKALEHARRAVDGVREAMQAEDTGLLRQMEVQMLTLRAIIEQAAEDLAQARATLTEGLALAQARGLRRPETSILETLGNLELRIGRHAQALAYFEASTARAEELGWVIYAAMGRLCMARCHFELGRPDFAAEQLTLAEAEAQRCESREVEGRCALLRAHVETVTGSPGAARARFAGALSIFEAIDSPGYACLARADLALLDLNEGRLPSAVAAAERIAADLAAGLSLASTDEALSPHMICYRIWAAARDARAGAALATAHTALQAMAARVGDDELRDCILENIPLHREIVSAWGRR